VVKYKDDVHGITGTSQAGSVDIARSHIYITSYMVESCLDVCFRLGCGGVGCVLCLCAQVDTSPLDCDATLLSVLHHADVCYR
jgi:hypothetical protein